MVSETIKKLIENMGLDDLEMSCDEENRKVSIFINDERNPYIKTNLQRIVQDFNLISQLITKKLGEPSFFIDINNYRLERKRIIVELAKAAARKAVATKAEIALPAMNAYERRLIHMELATRPDVKTESVGSGKNRYVIIKLV